MRLLYLRFKESFNKYSPFKGSDNEIDWNFFYYR